MTNPFNQIFTTDVSMVQITTKKSPKTYSFKTASKVEKKPLTVEGKEQALDIKGVRCAVKKAKNSYVGSEIKLTDNSFTPEVYCVVAGGTVTYEEDNTTFKSYEAPAVGEVEEKQKFDLILYSECLDETGAVTGYLKETYENCEGELIGTSQEDDKFFAPEFTITSRPPRGSKGFKIEFVNSLPVALFDVARGTFVGMSERIELNEKAKKEKAVKAESK